jgi:tetratricopeptide (TPR) repeat protein
MHPTRADKFMVVAAVLAGSLLAQGDVTDLIRHAVQLQQGGDFSGAAEAYRAVLQQRPDDVATHVNLGVVLVHLGQFDAAIAEYDAASKLLPGDPRIELNLALAYQKSGRIRDAAQRLEGLHNSLPQNSQVTMLLADCQLQMGDDARTIELLEPLEAQNPDDLGLAYMLGMAFLHKGRISEGQVVLDRILRNGDTAEARFLLGTRMFEAGDYPAAVKELATAIDLNPKLPGLQSLYGRALLNTGDPDAALEAFGKELGGNANDYPANLGVGQILVERKQYREATGHLRRALQMRPESAEGKLSLAQALKGTADFEGARPYAESAVKDMPNSAEAHRTLASIDEGLHRKSEALAEWKAAKAIEQEQEARTGGPKLNDSAPDFSLRQAGSDKTVAVHDFRGKTPLVLVFGSYTCPNLRVAAEPLRNMYERYGGRVPFLLVYIREAHDTSKWQSTRNAREQISLAPAKTFAEKESNSMVCSRKLHLPFPSVVDGMDGAVERAYQAWPSRAFIIGDDGKILYSSHLTELDFHRDEMEAVLRRLVQHDRAARR